MNPEIWYRYSVINGTSGAVSLFPEGSNETDVGIAVRE